MAKLVGPLHSTEARGRVGGLIFNSWRGVNYAKSFAGPCQPRTQRQLQIRAWTTQLVRSWADLSQAERDGWNDYAVDHPEIDWTGNPRRITGANWYVRLGVRLLDQGKALVDTAPVTSAPPPPAAFACTNSTGTLSMAWTAQAGTGISHDIWLYGPHSVGIQGKITKAVHNSFKPGETSPATIADLLEGHYTVFCRALDEATGLDSTWVSDTVDLAGA